MTNPTDLKNHTAPKNINYHTEVGNVLFFIHNCYHAEVGLPPFPVKPQRGSVCVPSTYAHVS